MKRTCILITVFLLLVGGLSGPRVAQAQATFEAPEVVVKDSSGAIVGPAHVSGVTLQVLVRDPTNGDPVYLQFGKWWFRSSDDDEIYFSGSNCTGNAYVFAPDPTFDSVFASVRGSTYVLGPDEVTGGLVPKRIYRSKDGETPGDNSAAMTTRWRITNSNFGQFEGPECTSTTTSTDTVLALPVASLDALVAQLIANKPFTAE